jgi:hypothetical protein
VWAPDSVLTFWAREYIRSGKRSHFVRGGGEYKIVLAICLLVVAIVKVLKKRFSCQLVYRP